MDTTWGLAAGTCWHGNQVHRVKVNISVLEIPSWKIILPQHVFQRRAHPGDLAWWGGRRPARDKAPPQADGTLARLISPSLTNFSCSHPSLPLALSCWDRPLQEKKNPPNLSCHVQLLTSRCRAIGKTCFLLFIYLPLGQWKAPGLLSSS